MRQMSRLVSELDERNLLREARVSELFNMQWQSLSRLRDMKMKLQSLEHDATNISQFCNNMKDMNAQSINSALFCRASSGVPTVTIADARRYLSADAAPLARSTSAAYTPLMQSYSARRVAAALSASSSNIQQSMTIADGGGDV